MCVRYVEVRGVCEVCVRYVEVRGVCEVCVRYVEVRGVCEVCGGAWCVEVCGVCEVCVHSGAQTYLQRSNARWCTGCTFKCREHDLTSY